MKNYGVSIKFSFLLFISILGSITCIAQADIKKLYARISPYVVVISTEFKLPNGKIKFGNCSGVLIDEKGTILTNWHCIDNAYSISVKQGEKNIIFTRTIFADASNDLALLKTNYVQPNFINFGNSEALEVGETVFAIGSPNSLEGSFSQGIISGSMRYIEGMTYLQHTASIDRGSSGGALINGNGELIGINTAMYNNFTGFAIPAHIVRKRIYRQEDFTDEKLREESTIRSAYEQIANYNFEDALNLVSRVITSNRTNYKAHNLSGKIYLFLSRHKEAETSFHEAIKLYNNVNGLDSIFMGELYMSLSAAFSSQRKVSEAQSASDKGNLYDPYNNYGKIFLANMYSGMGDYSKAIQTVNDAIRMRRNSQAYISRAAINQKFNRLDDACYDIRYAKKIDKYSADHNDLLKLIESEVCK